jgi:hypothetical protein
VEAPQVRGHDHVVEGEERRFGGRLHLVHVDGGARDLSALQGVDQSFGLVDAAARRVDQAHSVLHLRELLGAEHADRLFGLGQVHRDEVGLRQQLVDRGEQLDAQRRGAVLGDVGVVADEAHLERAGTLGDERSDAPEPDDRERLLVELGAGELAALPLARLQGSVGLRDHARLGHEQSPGVFGGRHHVGGRRVAYDDAALGGSRHVHVVDADARTADDLELARRLDHGTRRPRRRTYDERVVVADHVDELGLRQARIDVDLVGLAQLVDAGIGDLVRDQYLHRHRAHSPMKTASAAMMPAPRSKS